MKKTIFGILLALVMSLSCVLCACAPADDKKPDEPDDPTPPPVTAATITGFDSIVSYPKQEYLPGEVFDKTGLSVKVKMSDDTTKTLFDSVFTTWTHKDEELTEDVDKITFTIPDTDPAITFDVPVTVGIPEGAHISIDTSALEDSYFTDTPIDLTVITVRYVINGATTILEPGTDCDITIADEPVENLAEVTFDTEGTYTFTVTYLGLFTDTFTVTVKDPNKEITPAIIEAEDCVYLFQAGTETTTKVETNEPFTDMEGHSYAESVTDSSRMKLSNGSSGRGAVINLSGGSGSTAKGSKVYFKFVVNVPTDGTYILKAKATGVGPAPISNVFSVNVNEAKNADGTLKFEMARCTGKIAQGNQVADYADLSGKKLTDWMNLYWWNVFTIDSYELKEGDNIIRIYLPNGFNANLDYFEFVKPDEATLTAPKLWNFRSGLRAKLDAESNAIYLEKGKTLDDLVGFPNCNGSAPEGHPLKYTLIYMELPNGEFIPVCTNWLSEIDYEKVGEQIVTVTIKKADGTLKGTAQFKLIIEDTSGD